MLSSRSIKADSYKEIKELNPKWKKYKRLGWAPSYWFYRLQWYMVEKFHYVSRFPTHVDIETCNICNLKCIMCPHSSEKMENPGFFDFEVYKRIVDEGAKYGLKSLKLNIRGEPLLHKKLVEMVEYAKQKGIIEVMFNTNAVLLTPEKSKRLIDAGLDYIIISIDGATKETYERIRVGAKFDEVVNNIQFLCDYRKEKKLKKPLIRLQYVKMKENVHEVPAYIDRWKDHVDVMTANDYSKRVDPKVERTTREEQVLGRANCPHPWRRLSVASNGEVLMCCGDWHMKGVLGNAKEQSLYDIWHSQHFNDIRRRLKKCNLDSIKACKDCFVLASYKWK